MNRNKSATAGSKIKCHDTVLTKRSTFTNKISIDLQTFLTLFVFQVGLRMSDTGNKTISFTFKESGVPYW